MPSLQYPRGQWRPGMPQDVSALIVTVFTVQMLIRGLDYITDDRDGVTASLTVVERAMPLQAWGVLFLAAAGAVIAGMALRRSAIIISGALLAAGLYAGLTWGLTLRMIERGWPWDGWRTPTQFLTAVAFWLLIAYGTRVMMIAHASDDHRDVRQDE
ncbi:putative membrane protein [Corynebacterium variabile DSM 44702]|uniref:Putative membrane protein n=2 Tax=Corynebacterium variabile TaxID=1727 RepID=G0HC70_CORVD|nr:putative membrane protein [Corynebacterium variabile DSM 44702]